MSLLLDSVQSQILRFKKIRLQTLIVLFNLICFNVFTGHGIAVQVTACYQKKRLFKVGRSHCFWGASQLAVRTIACLFLFSPGFCVFATPCKHQQLHLRLRISSIGHRLVLKHLLIILNDTRRQSVYCSINRISRNTVNLISHKYCNTVIIGWRPLWVVSN